MDNVKKFDHPKRSHNYDLEKHVFNILFIMKNAPAIGLLGDMCIQFVLKNILILVLKKHESS